MTSSATQHPRGTIGFSALAPTALTGVAGVALTAVMLAAAPAGPADLGHVRTVASCTPHSSGLANVATVKVTRVKAVSVRRLEVRQDTVKVRVKLAVTGIGTAAGHGYADACPGGVSHPQEIDHTVRWTGTRTVRTDYTASGRTTKVATRAATKAATKLCRAAAVQDIKEATIRKAETVVRDLAVAASANTPTPRRTPPGAARSASSSSH